MCLFGVYLDQIVTFLLETLHITLSYFSGLPDPAWNITSSDDQYNNIMNLLDEAASRHMLGRPREMPSRLGYKGFLVRRNTTTHWVFGPGNVELQKVLLSTAPEDKVSSELRETLTEDIDTSSNSSGQISLSVLLLGVWVVSSICKGEGGGLTYKIVTGMSSTVSSLIFDFEF